MINKELKKRIFSSIVLIPLSFFFIMQGSIPFIFYLSLIFAIVSFEWIRMTKKIEFIRILGLFFIIFSFYTTIHIRQDTGLNFFLFLIIICIFTDIGGYLFGKTLKGPKLTNISPNKTYSGVVGSFLFSLISGFLYFKYFDQSIIVLNKDPSFFILLILFISFTSQIGDLIISFFKRKAKLKDTGKILPGHGGFLDRIDGLIFVMPIIYVFLLQILIDKLDLIK